MAHTVMSQVGARDLYLTANETIPRILGNRTWP